jgi:prepilin-type N-terminal cleavage/methylation domain
MSPFRRRAFTLIELLTVIAIIGVLAAIIVPVTGRVRDSAKASKCASNIRQIAHAALLYADDHKGVLPSAHTPNDSGGYSVTAWWWSLYPDYIGAADVFACPNDETTLGGNATFTRNGRTLANGKVSYGNPGQSRTNKALGKSLRVFSIPARTVLFTEFQQNTMQLAQTWHADKPFWVSVNAKSPEGGDVVAFPHSGGGKTNLAFLDGHVTAMSARDIVAARDAKTLHFGTVGPF